MLLNSSKAALAGGAMIHTDYRGEYLFFIREVLKTIEQTGTILYSFCNKESYPVFTSRFMKFSNFQLFKQYLIDCRNSNQASSSTIQSVDIKKMIIKDKQLATFNRDHIWLKWRTISRSNTYQFGVNQKGEYYIFKKFGETIDLMAILNCYDVDEYISALAEFIGFIQKYRIGTHLLLFSSNRKLSKFIENYLRYEELSYKRYLCFNHKTEETKSYPTFVELIDSDTF